MLPRDEVGCEIFCSPLRGDVSINGAVMMRPPLTAVRIA